MVNDRFLLDGYWRKYALPDIKALCDDVRQVRVGDDEADATPPSARASQDAGTGAVSAVEGARLDAADAAAELRRWAAQYEEAMHALRRAMMVHAKDRERLENIVSAGLQ